MSERFRALLAEWKQTDANATAAQAVLNAKYQAFIDGTGPEPTEFERQEVARLRQKADATLEVALNYVKATARGPVSRK